VLALAPYGVSRSDAFAASAIFHVPTYLAVTLLGLWLLKGAGYRVGEIQRAAESAAEAAAGDEATGGQAPPGPGA
jgi:hypothetical protein